MSNDSIRTRVEALLRLAEDPNAAQNERDIALDRIATITEKYKIDASRLDPHSGQWVQEDIVTHTFDVPTAYGLSDTRHRGLYLVVEAMGADSYIIKNGHLRKNGTQRYVSSGLVVHAPESTMHVLKMLLPSLLLQEASASAAFLEAYKKSDRGMRALTEVIRNLRASGQNPKSFESQLSKLVSVHRKSFSLAFYAEAAKRIQEKRSDAVQGAGEGYALVVVDTATRIQRSMEDLDLVSRKPRKDAGYSAEGWDHGTAAGQRAMVGQTEVHGGRRAIEGC